MVRIVLGNLIIGNVMGMLYSLAGGVLCWLVMCLLKPHVGRKQIWVMSVFGALGHNAGQLAVAVWVSGTQAVLNHLDKLKHTAESSTSPKD